MTGIPKKILLLLYSVLLLTSCNVNDQIRKYEPDNKSNTGAVSSAHELATKTGIQILQKGGNAIDAAVGTAFTLAVVYPQAGNLGGGGFIVMHLVNGKNTTIDFRETAPSGASKNMYLDKDSNIIEDLSLIGALSSGVPGSVSGLLYALEKYGSMKREDVLKYAIDIADTGFFINAQLIKNISDYKKDLNSFESTRKLYGKEFKEGDKFIQKDLAGTLKRISASGVSGFYDGITADMIVNEMKINKGIISKEDLKNYKAIEREPVKGNYKDYEIYSMGPPSSGGISLIYLLNILEKYDLKKFGYGSIENTQLLTEAMRRVYADRSEFMGDADFVNVPVDILTSKLYAERRMKSFIPGKASTSKEINHGDAYYRESDQTTHLSVADKNGNIVSLTTTINDIFGSKLVVEGAGFFLNDEMDDFSIKPGTPNMFGLIGNDANAIQPRKRMLSSMTPVIILKNNEPFLTLGSPGGSRIITTVLQTFINIVEYNKTLGEAIDLPRFHHQWFPDEIQFEKGYLDSNKSKLLREMGYNLKTVSDFGRVDAIMFKDGYFISHTDRRGSGLAISY